MKKLFVIILLSCINYAGATTYFVKKTGGNGSGLDDPNAWSFAKLNATNLTAGDIVLFNKGDIFYGSLNTFSGTSSNLITYGAYGTGDNPKITGLSTLNNWTQYSENIYYATLNLTELNVVILDGSLQAMGRYPKAEYLTYGSHYGNTSITGTTTLPFNPVGAEVVIRKIRQITDRHIVTSYSGKTMGLSTAGAFGTNFGNNTNIQPTDGNGYFIQSSLGTLTQLGNWYYDTTNKRLYMHFGTGTPSSHLVKASTNMYNIRMDNKSYITFQNIDFEGANSSAVNSNNINHISFNGCNFSNQKNGITTGNGTTYLTIQNGSMSNFTNSGIIIQQLVTNIVIDNITFNNIGIIPGSGGSGDAQQLGIWIQGDNTTVRNCTLTNIGYHGIVQIGNNTLAEKNFIDTYGITKDDCGGVYDVWAGPGSTPYANKIIRNNIILNSYAITQGINDYGSGHGEGSGIYLDNSSNVHVTGNTIAHGSWGGILCVDIKSGNWITNNLIFNCASQFYIYESGTNLRGVLVTDNTFIAKNPDQNTLYFHTYINDNPAFFGTLNNNIYARPIDDNNTMTINREYTGGGGTTTLSLAAWKSTYNQDANSAKSAITTTSTNNLRFDYNYSSLSSSITSIGCWKDVKDGTDHEKITIPPFSGKVSVSSNILDKPVIVEN